MSTELTVAEKQIGAMIESVVMQKPELKDKLTIAIALSYLKLPDASFGWIAKGEMSREIKLMAVASHLQAGALPGYGHIYFLGNKLYQSAAFIQSKANSDPNFNIVGEAVFAPFDEGEAAMFCIEKGDMACKVILTIEMNNKEFTATGHGIVGQDEILRGKPGLTSKKNRAMTLKTRAMRDLLSRFYPTNGVPVGPETGEEPAAIQAGYTDQLKIVEPEALEKVREDIKIEEAEIVEEKSKEDAKKDYKALVADARSKGVANKAMLEAGGVKNVKYLFDLPMLDIYDRLEVMQDFVDKKIDEPEPEKEETPTILVNPHVEAAKSRLTLQTNAAGEMGLKSMEIIGDNPHNIIQRGDVKEMTEASDKLVAAMKNKPEDPFASNEPPEAGKKAYAKIAMLLQHPSVTDEKVRKCLELLNERILREGDDSLIVEAGGLAVKGDFTKIENLIKERQKI